MASLRMTWIVATLLAGAGLPLGCGGSSARNPPANAATAAAADDDPMSGLAEHHRYHHHGGVTLFVAMSLDTLGVAPDQQAAVDKIHSELNALMAPARAAEQALTATLADELAAETFDVEKVNAAVSQVAVAAAAVHAGSADALDELHKLLTPAERAALVDKVAAHWAVWREANAGATDAGNTTDGYLAMDLDLTADQMAKIHTGLGDDMKSSAPLAQQEITAHLAAFSDAFRSETFEAHAINTESHANEHLAGWGAAHMAHFVEVASLVLTPEQRTKLVERLREHASHDAGIQGAL